jgi:hypothetical protein
VIRTPRNITLCAAANERYHPHELGAAGLPYTTQADYLPIPAEGMGPLVDCEGNISIYAPKQKVLAAIDILTPEWSADRACGLVEAHA